jgi:hypothetical protein
MKDPKCLSTNRLRHAMLPQQEVREKKPSSRLSRLATAKDEVVLASVTAMAQMPDALDQAVVGYAFQRHDRKTSTVDVVHVVI